VRHEFSGKDDVEATFEVAGEAVSDSGKRGRRPIGTVERKWDVPVRSAGWMALGSERWICLSSMISLPRIKWAQLSANESDY
jgi:hypothetical protein